MAISGAPRLPSSVVFRARLADRFEDLASVVVARAPAGYGKTVAMAQWATATSASGVWMRIRGDRVEAHEFVQRLAEELRAAGLVADGGPLALGADALAGGADPWRLLRSGLQQIGPVVIVLDAVDRLNGTTQRGLVEIVQEMPQVRLRATARRTTIFDEPALRASVDVSTLTAADLVLSRAEAAQLLSTEESDQMVDELMAHGGVPLFGKLFELARSDHPEASPPPANALPLVVDSFVRMQADSPEADQGFLRFITVTSLADSLDPELASQLMAAAPVATEAGGAADHGADADALLDRAEAEGLGLWTHGAGSGPVFTYTPLVREAFERRLRAESPNNLVRELTKIVARGELRSGRYFSALRRAAEAEDWSFASRVVRSSWNELLRNHGPQVRELFRDAPLSLLRQYPLLTTLLALDYNRTGRHRLRALEYFALARYSARKQRTTASPADRAVLRAIETGSLRVSGQLQAALAPARDGYEALLTLGPSDRDDLGRTEPTLLNQFGTSFFYAGQTDLALDAFARSTAVGEARGLRGGLQGLALSAGALAVAGDLPESRELIAQAHELDWPDGWLDGYMGSFLRLAEAMSALERFDLDTADRHIRSLDPHRETIEHWPLLAHVDALTALLRGQVDRARYELEAEIRHQHRRRAAGAQTVARLARTRSLIELAAGNPVAAERALDRTRALRTSVVLARIELVRRRPEEALRRLLDAEGSLPAEERSSRVKAEDLVLRAAAWALMGETGRASDAAAKAFEYLANREQGLALALLPADALDALRDAAAGAGFDTASVDAMPRMIPSSRPSSTFTPREAALIRVLPRASSNSELAAELSVSLNTVKTQLRGLYRKLGVNNRDDALAALDALGLMARPPRYDSAVSPDPFG